MYISDQAIVNAFAYPTKSIVLTKGLLETVEYDEELFAVIAHEVGHLVHGHSKPLFFRGILASGLATFFGATNTTSNMAISAFSNFYSREAERESDLYVVKVFNKANLSIEAASSLMHKLKNSSESSTLEFMSTHPLTDRRVQFFHRHQKVGKKPTKSKALINQILNYCFDETS